MISISSSATTLTIATSTQRLCCHLRWRELSPEAGPEGPSPCSADGFFWCTHTMGHLGPDGRVADEGSCRSGRVCYEAVCPPETAAAEKPPVESPAG
jgi:hypothetical protein